MTVVVDLVVGIGIGVVAGTAFFGGLAWTVRRLPTARSPAALTAGSVVLRLAVVAAGAFAAATSGLVAVAGFLAAVLLVRGALVRRIRGVGAGG